MSKGDSVSSIPNLQAEVTRLSDELFEAKARLREAREQATEFKVGDIVSAKKTGTDRGEAIIREVDAKSWATWYRVSFRKKNGEFSSQRRRVFSDVRPL